MTTKERGDISEAMAVGHLIKAGYVVLAPLFGERLRYDFVIDRGLGFERVQCKTGHIEKGVVQFNTKSVNRTPTGYITRNYRQDVELFAVYCVGNDTTYLLPVDAVPVTVGKLRILPSKNNQKKGIILADSYKVS